MQAILDRLRKLLDELYQAQARELMMIESFEQGQKVRWEKQRLSDALRQKLNRGIRWH
jgi:hypothetical protein